MPFAKQLSYARSRSLIRLPSPLDRRAVSDEPSSLGGALLALPQQAVSLQAIPAAVSRLMVETVVRFAAHAGNAFPGLLLTILFWVISEFLAGCAAYAKAMHPTPVIIDDHIDFSDPIPSARQCRKATLAGARPSLSVISGNTRYSVERHGLLLVLEQTPPVLETPAYSEHTVPAHQAPSAASRWHVSIRARVVLLLSRMRKAQARRRALVELNAFDDRTLRDIGIRRGEIESAVRRETWE